MCTILGLNVAESMLVQRVTAMYCTVIMCSVISPFAIVQISVLVELDFSYVAGRFTTYSHVQ